MFKNVSFQISQPVATTPELVWHGSAFKSQAILS